MRTLHVGGNAIQSAMPIGEPREALMIGLGGGSLAKFFHRRRRGARAEMLESLLGVPFARYVSRLRVMNRCTLGELMISA